MKVTIIPSDKYVIIDGVLKKFDFETDPNYHAIQWDGEKGFIETIKGRNIILNNLDDFQDLLDKHQEIIKQEESDRILGAQTLPEPSELEVILKALETKTGITKADKDNARKKLKGKK